jgi:NAD(P)H dehydrogenase (quinone)
MNIAPLKVLYVYCHPLPESFHAAVRVEALAGLAQAGHQVDMLDLYAEKFDPVLSEDGRRRYHDIVANRQGLEAYVERLQRADVLVLQFPTWSFGPPAMLKGFVDRMMMPGVGFDLSDPRRAKPLLQNIKHVVGIVSYGRPRLMALGMADPPRKFVTRYLRWFAAPRAGVTYLAIYHMNTATDRRRRAFLARVRQSMSRLRARRVGLLGALLPA